MDGNRTESTPREGSRPSVTPQHGSCCGNSAHQAEQPESAERIADSTQASAPKSDRSARSGGCCCGGA